MQPGSDLSAYAFFYSGTPFIYFLDWFRYVMYSDPNWYLTAVTLADLDVTHAQNPYSFSTLNADLSAFSNTGVKLLACHGIQHHFIYSENSECCYH